MKVTFAHICDYASLSRDGKLSINGIFNVLNALRTPATHPQLYLVFQLEMVKAELDKPLQVLVELRDEDGEMIVKAHADLTVRQERALNGVIQVPQLIGFSGVPFKKAGTYSWSIFLNKRLEASVPLTVRIVTPADHKPGKP